MLRLQWNVLSKVGLRNASWLATSVLPSYRDTLCYFSSQEHPGVDGYVALTIDDGLCRQTVGNSLVEEVRSLLQRFRARATFFLCSDYTAGLEDMAKRLLADGHEFGNHCPRDREYASFQPAVFEEALVQTSDTLAALTPDGKRPTWFRAPQAKFTASMREAVLRNGMRHALGDCYCDDYAIEDPLYIAETLLGQVASGSVIVLHMPERGFREHCLEALDLLLQGLSERGLQCTTLSELDKLAASVVADQEVPRSLTPKRGVIARSFARFRRKARTFEPDPIMPPVALEGQMSPIGNRITRCSL